MKRFNKELIPLGIILLIALGIRLWGLKFALPYLYTPDESIYIGIFQKIFKTGDLNPHFFNYPSLFIYLNALAYGPYYLLGKAMGVLSNPADILAPTTLVMGVSFAPMPTTVFLGRLVTILFGAAAVPLVYFTGKQLTGSSIVGLLASLLMAISPANVWNSRFIAPDTFVTFFVLAALCASALVFRQGKTWQYILAGICVGLAASSKYNGGLIVVALVLAHFLRLGRAGLRALNLYLALGFAILAFFAATPFALLDPTAFLAGLSFEAHHYSTGHWGMEGNTLVWYIAYMGRTAAIVYLLAFIEILRGFFFRSKELILLASFPVVYFVFINLYVVRNDRTFLPLTPFLFLLAASLLVYLFGQVRQIGATWLGKIFFPALLCLTAAALVMPASKSVQTAFRLTSVDAHETARIWINANLPPDSNIAIESYSPYVDPSRYTVRGFQRMIDHPASWYINQGFDFLVFSQEMYGRFYLDPGRYADEIAQYNDLFSHFTLVKDFNNNGEEIRIYRVK